MPDMPPPSAQPLDPGIRAFMGAVAAIYGRHPDYARLPPARQRQIAAETRLRWNQGGPVMAETRELLIPAPGGPLRLRLHRPVDRGPLPALAYVHGGGWTVFSLDTHDRLMRSYADAAGIAVVGIDYALSPEAKFPVAHEQVVAAMRWLAAHGAGLGIDPARLMLGGDSAGGNLSLGAALRLRDAGEGGLLRALLINYGALECSQSRPSYAAFDGPSYNLTAGEMRGFWANYLRPGDETDPYAVPLLGNLSGLPQMLVVIADGDVLADENHALAVKVAAAGGQVEKRVYPGSVHSFLDAAEASAVARQAIAETSAWLADASR